MVEDKNKKVPLEDDHVDDHVDDEIKKYLSMSNPKSFFMFAGAGSGKTRSLTNALLYLDKEMGSWLSLNRKQIAAITFTNAASDEISRRLQYKPIFAISTIHSFLWELIKHYQKDIKKWVITSIGEEIANLRKEQASGRAGSAAAKKREEEINRKTQRLARIDTVKRFSYNPNGENMGHDSLNHSEVIKMGSDFIALEDTMQKILINKYPILLIDESQDTKKELVDALLIVQQKYSQKFIIGMFGDTMQKIYMDGKEDLAACIPNDWERPKKVMNHRSAKRIVKLANDMRCKVDDQKQQARSDAEEGTARLFIASAASDKEDVEKRVTEIMAEVSDDDKWLDESQYKSLILEHHMAAARLGFSDLYTPLKEIKSFDTSLRDGSIPELSFLTNIVSPLVEAYQAGDDFGVAKIVRQHSPLLDRKVLVAEPYMQVDQLKKAKTAVDDLLKLWNEENPPANCIDVIRAIQDSGLFKLSDRAEDVLAPFINGEDEKITALRKALSVFFDEFKKYSAYVADNTRFATHQGIKGLEFPRVMVIMDNTEARGSLFSYEKLFGAKAKSPTDRNNERDGRDTSIMRTARLFYVACTRAEKSLAVIAYTENINAVKNTALINNWFLTDEIHQM